MEEDTQSGPLFRASKRRKTHRKRSSSDASDNVSEILTKLDATTSQYSNANGDRDAGGVLKSQKKVGGRKYGIAFTSGDGQRNAEGQNEERALVSVIEDGEQETVHSERFVKPTGRVAVTENKHMIAYIDSKMAEKRALATTPTSSTAELDRITLTPIGEGAADNAELSALYGRVPTGDASAASEPRTFQEAQSKSTRVYQRPTKRRPPPQRDQTDVVRDSIIDQIMHESQVPHYDQSVSNTLLADGDEVDNDAATAEAFKAQLLVEMEDQKKRRKPPLSSTATKGTTTSTGPKLGGSRNQREKMRALEEARASAGKK